MAEITKQDIKDAVVEALEPFAKAVQADFQNVDKRFDGTEKRLDGLENEIVSVKSDLKEVKSDVKEMKENSSELFIKIDGFVSMYGRQAEEITVLANQSARLEKRVSVVEKRLGIQ